MADAGSGTYGILRVDAGKSGENAAANWSDVDWAVYHIETGTPNQQWNGDGVSASVSITGEGTVWAGEFTFDWRPGGNQVTLIASGTTRIYHNANGTPPSNFAVSASIGDTGSDGAGRGASVSQGVSLNTLKVIPGQPSTPVATRVSDTQASLTWTQSSATNGQPTANKIQKRTNGGSWTDVATISPATSATVAIAANQKVEFRLNASNSAGTTSATAASNAIYTSPAAPDNVDATKSGSNIVVSFDENVAYSEYEHEVWHGVVSGGVTTWDGSALTTLASGDLSYTHVAPNSAQVHIYRVRARAGARASSFVSSNSVQLLAAPSKPTIGTPAAIQNKALVSRFTWTHNPVDSSAQSKYQVRYSTNGGTTWTTGAKVASALKYIDYPANTFTGGQQVTFQVRTKGSYDSGSDGDASYSPWSNSAVVTYKTIPVATITSPVAASVLADATLRVNLGFSQAEAGTYVKAELELLSGATVLEALTSVLQTGITFKTKLLDGGSYSVRARVQDSNGLWSTWVTNAFTVDYIEPVAATGITTEYLPDTGFAQINMFLPTPSGSEEAAATISIFRTIDGVEEVVLNGYPAVSGDYMTFLDTVPTIHGLNSYRIVTYSALGAQTEALASLETAELRYAFLSKGPSYSFVAAFGGNIKIDDTMSVASDTVQAAGRTKPIGLFGVETSLVLKVTSTIFEGFGSTIPEVRNVLLVPGKACYRDSTGRRVFGTAKGSISYKKDVSGELSFTLEETS